MPSQLYCVHILVLLIRMWEPHSILRFICQTHTVRKKKFEKHELPDAIWMWMLCWLATCITMDIHKTCNCNFKESKSIDALSNRNTTNAACFNIRTNYKLQNLQYVFTIWSCESFRYSIHFPSHYPIIVRQGT